MKKSRSLAVGATVIAATLIAGASVASATSDRKALSSGAVAELRSARTPNAGELIGQGTLRVSGADRYETAVAVSQGLWSEENTGAVFLAVGTNFPDALSAGASTADLGPVLLTEANYLPEVTRAELNRLRPCLVFVIGGTPSVSDAVAAQADAYTDPDRCFG